MTSIRSMDLKGQVIVYSILGCPHCMKAKNTLQEKGVPYTDISLDRFPQCREELTSQTGKKTVPQIFFNATHVGGNDDLQTLIEDKERFQTLLDDVINNEAPPNAPKIPDPDTAVPDSDVGEFSCEPDEYAILVQNLRKSGLIKDHRRLLSVHKNTFVGKEFVDWIVETKGLDRSVAVEMGQKLIDQHFGHNLKSDQTFQDSDTLYRLMDDDESTALNAGEMSQCEPRPAGDLGEGIRKLILKIYAAFLSPDGKKVNYKGIAGSDEFKKYVRLTKELQRVNIADASRDEKVAFFINIYNALVIHANVSVGPPVNLWQRYKFFNTVRYIIGGHAYSLQDMENGVLRANRKGVGMLFRPFSQSDPRYKIALQEPEPYIHFALVCGAKSCPPIKTYSTDGLEGQLKLAAEAFLDSDDGLSIDMNKKQIMLTKILSWYQEDFGRNKEEVLQWILGNLPDGERKTQLKELLDGKSYKVGYKHYDWGLNS